MSDAARVRIARARGEADSAKARLMGTVDEAKERLAPGRLASEAVQTAKDKSIVVADDAVTKVKERPGLSAGLATAATLYVVRRPLFKAVRRMFKGSEKGSDRYVTETHTRRRADQMEDFNG